MKVTVEYTNTDRLVQLHMLQRGEWFKFPGDSNRAYILIGEIPPGPLYFGNERLFEDERVDSLWCMIFGEGVKSGDLRLKRNTLVERASGIKISLSFES